MKDLDSYQNSLFDVLAHGDLQPAMNDCHNVAMNDVNWAFDHAARSDGTPWPPRKDTKPHPILQLTGALRAAATGGASHAMVISSRSMGFGVYLASEGSLAGARAHNFGHVYSLPYPRVLPARRYLGLTTIGKGTAVNLIAANMNDLLKAI